MFVAAFDDASLPGDTTPFAGDRGAAPRGAPAECAHDQAMELVEWEMSPTQVGSLISALAVVFALGWLLV
jgi:hypothetical protein